MNEKTIDAPYENYGEELTIVCIAVILIFCTFLKKDIMVDLYNLLNK